MAKLRQTIFQRKYLACWSLLLAFSFVMLLWILPYTSSIRLKVGDPVNINLITLINGYANAYFLFIATAILCAAAAFKFAIDEWKRFLKVFALTILIGFCGLIGFVSATFGNNYTYRLSISTEFGDRTFKVVHAIHSGDMIAEADYLLLECEDESSCIIIDKFDDYDYDASKSKTVSFFVEPSDNALYIKIGEEVQLVSNV